MNKIVFPQPLEIVEAVFDIKNLDEETFQDFILRHHETLLTIEAITTGEMPPESEYADKVKEWASLEASANANAAILEGYEQQAQGLLSNYYRRKGISALEAGREAKMYLGIFREITARWDNAAKSIMSRKIQAMAHLKRMREEYNGGGA